MNKETIRKKHLKQRLNLLPNQVQEASEKINKTLIHTSISGPIIAYIAIQNEPHLDTYLTHCHTHNITIYLPKYDPKTKTYQIAAYPKNTSLSTGKHNVLEPTTPCIAPATLSNATWLIPGVAFDKTGYRIGFGYGTYDTLLQNTQHQKIGICYQWQIIKAIPPNTWDIPCDQLIHD